eukprot:238085-Hanusia_phi.AAC.6
MRQAGIDLEGRLDEDVLEEVSGEEAKDLQEWTVSSLKHGKKAGRKEARELRKKKGKQESRDTRRGRNRTKRAMRTGSTERTRD